MENSNSEDMCGVEPNVEGSIDDPAPTSSSYKLFSRQATGHQMVGGRPRQLPTLPELVLYFYQKKWLKMPPHHFVLKLITCCFWLMITLGKDFRLFFKVVIALCSSCLQLVA